MHCITATSSDGEYYVMKQTYDCNGRWVFKRKDDGDRPRYIYYHNGDELENIISGWKVSNSIWNNLYYAPTAQCMDYYDYYESDNGMDVVEIKPKIKQNYSYTDFDYCEWNIL